MRPHPRLAVQNTACFEALLLASVPESCTFLSAPYAVSEHLELIHAYVVLCKIRLASQHLWRVCTQVHGQEPRVQLAGCLGKLEARV